MNSGVDGSLLCGSYSTIQLSSNSCDSLPEASSVSFTLQNKSEVVCLHFVTVIRCEKISYSRELLYFLPYEILLWPFTNLQEMVYYQYLMEALTLLPVENLHLKLVTSGHAVISCVFHFLKISTSIRRLFVHISEGIQVCFTLSTIEYFGCL